MTLQKEEILYLLFLRGYSIHCKLIMIKSDVILQQNGERKSDQQGTCSCKRI